jgi:hypothetical protein
MQTGTVWMRQSGNGKKNSGGMNGKKEKLLEDIFKEYRTERGKEMRKGG